MFSHQLGRRRQAGVRAAHLVLAAALLSGSGCGSLGPSQRTEQTRSRGFAGVECEPGLVLECEPACSRGDARACEIAGLGYLDGKAVTRDLPRARIMLERACEKGQALACSGWAKMAADGQGVDLSVQRRSTLLTLGCNHGDGNACFRLGRDLLSAASEPTRETHRRAHEYFERACQGNDPDGCLQLGIDAKTGRAGSKDVGEAASLLSGACASELAVACYELGDLQRAPGTAVHNPARARQHFDKACSLGLGQACSALASLMEAGERNVARARELHERACELSQWPSCMSLGRYEVATRPSSAEAAFQKACAAGIVEACFEQAKLLEGRTPGLEPDPTRALPLYEQACSAALRPACAYAAQLELKKYPSGIVPREQRERVVNLTQQGCQQERHDESCLAYAGWLATGENGVTIDAKKAAELLGPLCAKSSPNASTKSDDEFDPAAHGAACFHLAQLHEHGHGIEKNVLGASTLYDKGCTAGHEPSCLAHAVLLWRGNGGVRRDPELAAARFKRACSSSELPSVRAEGCVHWGFALMTGIGTPRDLRLAKDHFERVCAEGNQLGCAHLGHYLTTVKGPETDKRKGEELLRAACDSANGPACFFLADLTTTTKAQRKDLLTRACALQVEEACSFKKVADP